VNPAAGDPREAGETPADEAGAGGRQDAVRRQAEEEQRRRRVFGDVLDGSTLDDRPEPGGAGPDDDRWLRDNVPPHHGD
jgi:hypothetical protein